MVPAYAATLLSKNGYDVFWDDAIARRQTYTEWKNRILSEKPSIIAIEAKTPVIKQYRNIINDIKQTLPETKIVLMGDHVTALPMESFENCKTDYVITGGDYDFSLLSIANVLNNIPNAVLDSGIYYREKSGKIKNTGQFQLNHNLETLPTIDRDLTDWKLYAYNNGNYKKTPGTYTMTGRDCWYAKCRFCSWTTIYPKFRTRSPESLLDEVGVLIEKYGIREIMDDTGTFPVGEWLRKFCKGMIERGYNKRINFDCNMRLTSKLTFEDMCLMKKAGFRLILVGIESANQTTLDKIDKGEKIEMMVETVKLMRKAGLFPHITIMFGYPWETEDDAKRTLELGRKLLIKNIAYTMQATVVIPYPGTPLYDECRQNDWLATEDWERFDMREPVMKTPMGNEKLMEYVRGLYSVSFHPGFLIRKLFSIRDWNDVKYFFRAGGKVLGHIFDFGGKKRNKKGKL
jgi:radical SAM superfamily enzyme YgiQ (UPF0313 family)